MASPKMSYHLYEHTSHDKVEAAIITTGSHALSCVLPGRYISQRGESAEGYFNHSKIIIE